MKKMYSRKSSNPKIFTADGKNYKTQALANLHCEWTKDKVIYEFTLPTLADKKRKNKFGALTASVNGIKFDSVMEAKYYVHLLHRKQEGVIKNIQLQVPFELLPAYTDNDGNKVRPIIYIADFVFETADGLKYIVDVKGTETPEFKLKWKMLGYKFPNCIRQVIQWHKPSEQWLTLKEIKKLKKAR